MFIFKQVKYTKDPGTLQPIYEFPLDAAAAADAAAAVPVIDTDGFNAIDVLTTYFEHDDFAKKLMTALVDTHRNIFAKQYTGSQLMKLTSHNIIKYDENTGTVWKCIPMHVVLAGGKFTINWELKASEAPLIDLGDIAASRPSSPTDELVDVTDKLCLEESKDDNLRSESRSRDDIKKDNDRRKLHDARLRAKLALFRAERAAEKYIERYGDDLSYDSDESDESSYFSD